MLRFMTSNENKVQEARDILGARGIEVQWLREEYTEVQADTLEEVVREALKLISHEGAFIEDSGLFVDELGGFPGVFSAYVFKAIGSEGILKLMEGVEDRSARFVSVVGVKGLQKVFKGEVRGDIAYSLKGESGFGYDPIFVPEGKLKTFAEDLNYKNQVSHRKRALERLAEHLSGEL
jgi:XTP/dITP diphosphohydrolase